MKSTVILLTTIIFAQQGRYGACQVRYDEKLEKIIYEPVSLYQEFRDYVVPWNGSQHAPLVDEKATK